jgi:anaerobic selenocysteine-containing dehydrogenase
LGYGEGASHPWLQELPDPLTTVVWNSWLEINPRTAREQGIRQGELVRVISPFGEVAAPAVYFPGMRPDTVAMPIGWGHRLSGRYAAGRGSNPLAILSPALDSESGAPATGATRVRLEPTGRRDEPIVIGSQITARRADAPI